MTTEECQVQERQYLLKRKKIIDIYENPENSHDYYFIFEDFIFLLQNEHITISENVRKKITYRPYKICMFEKQMLIFPICRN